MKNTLSLIMIMTAVGISTITFQNCSEVGFSADDSAQQKSGNNGTLEVEDPVDPPVDPEEPASEDPDNHQRFACDLDNIKDIRINILRAYIGDNEVQIAGGDRSLVLMSEGFNLITNESTSSNMIRLVLSDINNQVIDNDDNSYALKTPSSQQSGLKINLRGGYSFDGNTAYRITFNLDTDFQVVRAGSKCLLKPVLHVANIEEVEF